LTIPTTLQQGEAFVRAEHNSERWDINQKADSKLCPQTLHQLNEGRVGTARSDFDRKNKRNLEQPQSDLVLKTSTGRRYTSLKSKPCRQLLPDPVPTKKLQSDKDDSSARASSLDKISEFYKVKSLIQL